jgi:hypothetical protein
MVRRAKLTRRRGRGLGPARERVAANYTPLPRPAVMWSPYQGTQDADQAFRFELTAEAPARGCGAVGGGGGSRHERTRAAAAALRLRRGGTAES